MNLSVHVDAGAQSSCSLAANHISGSNRRAVSGITPGKNLATTLDLLVHVGVENSSLDDTMSAG